MDATSARNATALMPTKTEHSETTQQWLEKNIVLAGPIIRRTTTTEVVFWLVTSREVSFDIALYDGERCLINETLKEPAHRWYGVGDHAVVHVLTLTPPNALPLETPLSYDIHYRLPDGKSVGLAQWGRDLLYADETLPRFIIKQEIRSLLHGSCRKPHFAGSDGMLEADNFLQLHPDPKQWPALMMLSGDQLYADDVAGPFLYAGHQVDDVLRFKHETLATADVRDNDELRASQDCYYRRERLLPDDYQSEKIERRFFGGVRKPIFTSDSAHNHLITFAEVMSSYLLIWSPIPWQLVDLSCPPVIDDENRQLYADEQLEIEHFSEGLARVRRVMAHLPTYMIFDDHDVTDDWNLSTAWEHSAYEHAFSRRIIGNAMLGYLLCQGMGNNPSAFDPLEPYLQSWLYEPCDYQHRELINRLLSFNCWGYNLPTSPMISVLDTRTQRWRRDSHPEKPSGLMDWEALTHLQNEIVGQEAVILISAAPVFGVKLIESVQRVFTWFGLPLMVDAENWMAHRGAANVMLNIFRHSRTPHNFTILSGDVHYSFAYDVELRHKKTSPHIWQITSSGIKNEFPHKLLRLFDRLDTLLYSPSSPLNWFTKRRRMRVRPREPQGAAESDHLLNGSGIGYVEFNAEGAPTKICQWRVDAAPVEFIPVDEH